MTLSLGELEKIYGVDRKIIRKTIAENIDFPPGNSNYDKLKYAFHRHEIDLWLQTHTWAYGKQEAGTKHGFGAQAKRDLAAGNSAGPRLLPPSIQKYIDKDKDKSTKSQVQTALLQLELDKKRGRLVDRDDVINELAPVVVALAKQLEMLPNLIGKKFGYTDEAIRFLRDYLDQARAGFLRSAMAGVLSDDYAAKDDGDE
jgi:hypothetical protein